MMSGKKHFLILMAMLLLVGMASADDITVSSAVSKSRVVVGDELTYSITIKSTKGSVVGESVSFEDVPQFKGFSLASKTPSRSSKQTFINGEMSASLVLTWRLTARNEGTAEVTAGSIVFRRKTYELERHVVEVGAPQAAQKGVASVDGRKVLSPRTENDSITKQLEGRMFALLEVDAKEPYLQESFEARCVLYVDSLDLARQIGDVHWEVPEWDGYYAENLELGSLRLNPVKVDGVSYQAVTIGRVRLTPTQVGKAPLPMSEGQLILKLRISRRSSFEDMFFDFGFSGMSGIDYQPLLVRLPMEGMDMTVRALPDEGRPDSFGNGVGKFAVAGSVDRKELTEDDFLTLRVEVGGEGFLGSVKAPELPVMEDWKLVAEPDVKIEQATDGAAGKKTFEYMLRAKHEGALRIPEFAYAFFDPEEERYVEQVVGPFEVEVAKGEERPLLVASASDGGNGGAAERPAIEKAGPEHINYIATEVPGTLAASAGFERSVGFFAMMLLSPLVFLVGGGVRWWGDYRERHGERLERRSALGRARRELKQAGGADEVAAAVRGYLGRKFGRSAAGLTLEEVEDLVLEHGGGAERAERLRRLVERCDQVEFLPGGTSCGAMQQEADEALDLLRGIDKECAV